ncbi:MAG: DUF45 domain-containing protein, partial [Muribaculaceae bacterium]|nr:DUF45 domain-containing protein [Muribaculaceae bacterium]
MAQYYIDDKEFGRIIINKRRGMVRFHVRNKVNGLEINCPTAASYSDIISMLNNSRDEIRKLQKPASHYSPGHTIECFGCQFTINEQTVDTNHYIYGHKKQDGKYNCTVGVPKDKDFNDPIVQNTISKCIDNIAKAIAPNILLPYANEVSATLGVAPKRYLIGRGNRKLGHCTPAGVIMLSRSVVFLTEELVRLIICHE